MGLLGGYIWGLINQHTPPSPNYLCIPCYYVPYRTVRTVPNNTKQEISFLLSLLLLLLLWILLYYYIIIYYLSLI